MSHADTRDIHLRALAELLVLEERLRRAPAVEDLHAVLVNDIALITTVETAALWLSGPGGGRVAAVMGLPEPARDAPFTVWMRRLCGHLEAAAGDPAPRRLAPADLPPALAAEWGDFLPAHAAWVPLVVPGGAPLGGLLVGRSQPWRDEDLRLLGRVAEAAAHARDRLTMRRRRVLTPRKSRRMLWAGVAVAALAAAMVVPVPLTALAPAEVRSAETTVVRAPLEGVIHDVPVTANQAVAPGELLLRFDDAALTVRLDNALQDLAIARAEFRQAQQTAMRNAEAASRRATLEARVAQAAAEVDHIRDLLSRVQVRADRTGVVIVEDRDSLPGRPVRLGERIMEIADPSAVEVEAWLPVEDSLPLAPGAPVSLYLNIAPDEGLHGRIRTIDYHAAPVPSGGLAFRVVIDLNAAATPDDGPLPRIGLRGTARLEAGEVPLYVLLFRRPWAALRPWLGQ